MPLSGWSKQAALAISANNTSNLTNYQIIVSVQGNNPAGAYYVDWTKVNFDGSDFRFTDSDSSTLINFWMYAFDGNAKTASFVVQVPSILANTTKTIYMYYWNPTAGSASNYTNTMAKRDVQPTDLAVLWCDTGSGTTLTDQTTNANTFTLSSASAWGTGEIWPNPLAGTLKYNAFYYNAAYNAQNTNLLNTVPASGYVEFTVMWGTTNGFATTYDERLFTKINTGIVGSEDLLDCYMGHTDNQMHVRKARGGVFIVLGSTTTSWTANTPYTIRISWGTGGFTLSVNGTVQASNADTTAWGNGTGWSFSWGAYNWGGTPSNFSKATMYGMKVYDSNAGAMLARYNLSEGTGTTAADEMGSYPLTLSSSSIWSTFSQSQTDNIFTSGNHVNFAGLYYAARANLYNQTTDNFEISFNLQPNALINSSSPSTVIWSKFNVNTKVLNCAGLYYGQATGMTLLNTMPLNGYIEMGVYPNNFTSTYYLFQKVNSEGATRDSLSIYTDTAGKVNIQVYKNGTAQTLTAVTALTASVWTRVRCHFGDDGLAIFLNDACNALDTTKDSAPNTGTTRAAIIGAQNYGGTVANIFNGKICSVRAYDLANSAVLAYYPNTEQIGATLNDRSGNIQTMTLSSASIWDAAATLTEGLYAFFVNGTGVIRFAKWQCGVYEYIESAQNAWASGANYYLRFSLGWEGMFIYVNEDIATYGNVSYTIVRTPNSGVNGDPTSDSFALGCQLFGGAPSSYINCRMDNVAIGTIHSSKRKGLAFYQQRKITADPFVRQGFVVNNSNVGSWGYGKKEFYEPDIVDDGSGTLQMLLSCDPITPSGTPTLYGSIGRLTSTDNGRTWTDPGSPPNPILKNYIRPYVLKDETHTTRKQSGNYWLYCVNMIGSLGSIWTEIHLFSFSSFTSAPTDLGAMLTLRPVYNISALSGNGTTTTVTTSTNHSYVVGERVCIDATGAPVDLAMDALHYVIQSVPAANQFTVLSSYNGSQGAAGFASSWDSINFGNICFWYDTGLAQYICVYEASGRQNTWWMGRLTSPDGKTWTRDVAHNPVLMGVNRGAAGGPDVWKRNGVYYMLYHESTLSTGAPTDISYATSTDTVAWTRNANRSPFIQRSMYWDTSQLADFTALERAGEVLVYMDQLPMQATNYYVSKQALWVASGLTMAQCLNPDPTIGLTWVTGRITAGDLNGIGGMGVMRQYRPLD